MNVVKEYLVVLSYVLIPLVVIPVSVRMDLNSLMIITLVLILMSVLLMITEDVNKSVIIQMVAITVPVLLDTFCIIMIIIV